MKDFLKTINRVVFKPKRFFKNAEKQSIKEPIKYLLIFTLLTQPLIAYHFLTQGSNYSEIPLLEISFTWQNFFLLYLVFVVWTLFFGFLRPSITHMFVKLFNKKAVFKNTYKGIIYSDTPCYIVTPFYLIAVSLLVTMIFVQNIWLLILFIISVLFWLGSDIYGIYLKLLAFKKLHKISMWKSFLCLYVFTFAFLFMAILVVEVIVILFLIGFGVI